MKNVIIAKKLIKIAKTLVSSNQVADQEGEYTNFTGYIDWKGSCQADVKNADFTLVSYKEFGGVYGGIIWHNGIFEKGYFGFGTWEKGTWQDGNFYRGVWKNGTWKDGSFQGESDGVWSDGTWENGTWLNGTWENGTWENGTWQDGDWERGTWNGGNDVKGNFHGKGDSPDKWGKRGPGFWDL